MRCDAMGCDIVDAVCVQLGSCTGRTLASFSMIGLQHGSKGIHHEPTPRIMSFRSALKTTGAANLLTKASTKPNDALRADAGMSWSKATKR
jgi:hypothetical protein